MRHPRYFKLSALLALTAAVALAQTKLTFEVASIKPSPPLDMAKVAAGIQAGQMPNIGPKIDGARAAYTYMALKELIVLAYKVKPYQITGPDWLASARFDIVAKLPDGASKDDAPQMLQALLEERFKLAVHRASKEHPVLALVVGKGGPKMKESAEAPAPLDENAPLKPGEMKMDTGEGPARVTLGKDGSAIVNMGAKGILSYRMDQATQSLHLEANQVTMAGFADMLTQFAVLGGGGVSQVVDMTELKGNYQVALDFTLADLMNMVRAAGVALPGAAGGGAQSNSPADAASEPGGTSSLNKAVQALGLKLEQRKAMVEQLIVDHAEKTPTEN
jgi:uncharacterized protein (TIGR03435 family)